MDHPTRHFLRDALVFIAIGLGLYAVLLVFAEHRVRALAERNPFAQISLGPPPDIAIFGASHAMPLGFEGIDNLVDAAAGQEVATLAIEGAGIIPTGVIQTALLARHTPARIILTIDSFTFLSPQWNEERITDSALLARAPYDRATMRALWQEPAARGSLWRYLTGFDKVNQMFTFGPDRSEAELTKFDRTYRPNSQIDDTRVAYLFPPALPADVDRYMAALERTILHAQAAGVRVEILLLPAPPRYHDRLPTAHQEVMEKIIALAARHDVAIVDHSALLPEDENYYDTDHLNRTGMTAYVGGAFGDFLRQ